MTTVSVYYVVYDRMGNASCRNAVMLLLIFAALVNLKSLRYQAAAAAAVVVTLLFEKPLSNVLYVRRVYKFKVERLKVFSSGSTLRSIHKLSTFDAVSVFGSIQALSIRL